MRREYDFMVTMVVPLSPTLSKLCSAPHGRWFAIMVNRVCLPFQSSLAYIILGKLGDDHLHHR